METIIAYLDSLFARYPTTEDTRKAKGELLINMEDRYNELLSQGKSKNEAVGAVIAQFGNIEELMDSLKVKKNASEGAVDDEDELPLAPDDEVEDFIQSSRKSASHIALGVGLCIASPALLIHFATSRGGTAMILLGLCALFVMVAAAVGLFITSSQRLKPFNAEKHFMKRLSFTMRDRVNDLYGRFRPTHTMWMCVGIGLCVISPLPIIYSAIVHRSAFGVVMLLLMVAVGVFCIIRVSEENTCYQKLLRKGEFNKTVWQMKNEEALNGVLWPAATTFFLLMGFFAGGWAWAWIVFPLAGLLQTTIVKAAQLAKKNKDMFH